ncbi:MAG: type IX secretion system membrane protein PorP/SprF [Cytophagaceae bacterium]|nr:type IX secretion system membrane protein PorP/SprF [Cytophagaceae bacterium]MDW8456369.1 type IX secretion system membrane protein PorP/SprF [Cytophagaceae bacterium]
MSNKKCIYHTGFLMIYYVCSFAQQDVHFSQYMFAGTVINPAYVGYRDKVTTSVLYKKQWSAISSTPVYQHISVDAPVNYERMGVGIVMQNDKLFIQISTRISALYAYKINVLKGKLSLGLAAGIKHYKADLSNLAVFDQDDVVLTQNNHQQWSPDFATGCLFQKKNFQAGFSVQHIAQTYASQYFQNIRHFYFNAAYSVKVSMHVNVIFSGLLKYLSSQIHQGDATAHLLYNKYLWAGVSYRTNDALAMQCGLDAGRLMPQTNIQLKIGYAYEQTISPYRQFNFRNTHEVMLLAAFNKNKQPENKKHTSPIFF